MYDDSDTTEEPVEFADFNAKLLVLDVLCYDLDVLEPYAPDEDEDTGEDLDVEARTTARASTTTSSTSCRRTWRW